MDGDIFKFKGESDAVGVVKFLEPTSPMLNYYEYEIIDRGEKCAIGIGVGEQTYPLDRMPGWNAHGIGYHADDGKLFHYDDGGSAYGKPFPSEKILSMILVKIMAKIKAAWIIAAKFHSILPSRSWP